MIAALTLAAILIDPPAGLARVEAPEDAVRLVAADLATLPEPDRSSVRYLWIPPGAPENAHHAIAFAVNTAATRSGRLVPGVLVGSLHRFDLREVCPDPKLFPKVAGEWDRIALEDPYFRRAGTLHPSIAAAWIAAGGLAEPPVCRADRWLSQALSANRGRYLELRGLAEITADETRSPEEIALARVGIFERPAIDIDGDRRVGMIRSDVTAKPRAVLALRGLVGSAWITEDLLDGDSLETDRHPLYHLLDSRPRGHEIIAELPNGLHLFLITDDRGTILREAPPDLVADSRVPEPHTRRLDGGAISCIRCHASGDGLRDCANDVARILATDVRILGDGDLAPELAREKIATRYAGRDFERHLERGRLDYSAAVDELTGGELNVRELSDLTAAIYGELRYPLVDPARAVAELGFRIEDESLDPAAVLRELLPTPVPVPGVAITEDPTVALLAAGVPIGRDDFDRVFGELLIRSAPWRNQK
jgi:hypothetical protein